DPSLPPNSPHNPRTTQILLQNENGPCPLLALVNAIMLSSPVGSDTALIRALQTRETISLQLLLDAVFDQLMSIGGLEENTDVSEVFAFLMTLHTGMNVNPKFVPEGGVSSNGPGTFENTKEMRLYSKFGIPLVHGWLPEPNSHSIKSFERSAPTYEDSQTLIFSEEELLQHLGNCEAVNLEGGVPVETKI